VLKEYKILISNTKSDLEDRLEAIDSRLKALAPQDKIGVGLDTSDRRRIQEERDSTKQCIKICTEVSVHIDQVRPNVFRDITTASGVTSHSVTSLEGLISARSVTADTLTKCKSTLGDATAQLEQHLHSMNSHLNVLQADHEGSTVEELAENMQEEYDSAQQSLEFCTQASERAAENRINFVEDVSLQEDGHQAIISTFGDLISAKRVTAGPRSTQWIGQISDESFQLLTKTLYRPTPGSLADTEAGAAKPFETRYGTGFPLSGRRSATE
jgi:hypothetical protein